MEKLEDSSMSFFVGGPSIPVKMQLHRVEVNQGVPIMPIPALGLKPQFWVFWESVLSPGSQS